MKRLDRRTAAFQKFDLSTLEWRSTGGRDYIYEQTLVRDLTLEELDALVAAAQRRLDNHRATIEFGMSQAAFLVSVGALAAAIGPRMNDPLNPATLYLLLLPIFGLLAAAVALVLIRVVQRSVRRWQQLLDYLEMVRLEILTREREHARAARPRVRAPIAGRRR